MKKRVYIHQFQGPSWKNLLPLSAGLLVSYAKSVPQISEEYDFEIDILRRDPSETVRSYAGSPHVLAFSTYLWNFRQSIEVARFGKRALPDSLVVFGGPMIPTISKDIYTFFESYPFVDIVVHGMGEYPFSEILLSRLGVRDLSSIAGISYRNRDGSLTTTKLSYDGNVDALPSPFLDGTFDEILTRYGDRITGALWETNRGCPNRCTFCVQGNPLFSKLIKFGQDRLYGELEWISQKQIPYVFSTDANFGILPRDVEISERVAELCKRNGFPKFFVVNWLKNSNEKMIEIIETLRRGGVHARLTLSMQSFNKSTLAAVKRRNISMQLFTDLKKECTKRRINTYTELILGLPNETYDSFLSNLDKCMDRYLRHFFVVYLCRLLDCTEMAETEYKNKYKLETRCCRVGIGRHEGSDSGVVEAEEIIVSTSTLPIRDWERAFTFSSMTLALYNFRLAFFIFNYLREEHSVKLIDLIKHIIQQSRVKESVYPTIGKALNLIRNSRQSIIDGQASLITLDFAGTILFEAHEAALLILINELDGFYKELWSLVNDYLRLKGNVAPSSILTEVFTYQKAHIPTWRRTNCHHLSFRFNIPQYFQSCCVDGKPISIREHKTYAHVGDENDTYDSPAELVKSRLTISEFEISEITFISAPKDGCG